MTKRILLLISLFTVNAFCVENLEDLFNKIKAGDATAVRKIITKNPSLLNDKDEYDTTPLMMAFDRKNEEIMQILLELGADIDAQDSYGDTILNTAAMTGNLKMVQFIVQSPKHPNINTQNNKGNTPLMSAVKSEHGDVADYLLKYHADVTLKNTAGETALLIAIEGADYDNSDIVKALLDHGADASIKNHNGDTLLIIATSKKHIATVQLLLEDGANVNAQGDADFTALIEAAKNGFKDILVLLLQYGANVNIENKYDQKASDLAYFNKHKDIENLLNLANKLDQFLSGKIGTGSDKFDDIRAVINSASATTIKTDPELQMIVLRTLFTLKPHIDDTNSYEYKNGSTILLGIGKKILSEYINTLEKNRKQEAESLIDKIFKPASSSSAE